ncbi:MAG TPA: 13E12 repeat family protein, partial [Candidatus Agrococcus pullicola]|nr:13E12 repeat family protein [Candidatus Agrococcus pullicola]
SFERAHAHINLRNELDLTLERLQELERDVEKVIALREDFRGAARDLIDQLVDHQDGDPELLFTELQDDVTTGLAASLRKSERAVQGQLEDAAALRRDIPATHVAWMDGEIHIGHVRVIGKAAADLDQDQLPAYEARVLTAARTKTPAQLARIAGRIARELTTPPSPEAVEEAVQDRAVWLEQQPDGMTHLTIKTTPVLAEAAYDRLRQAFGQRDRRDERGLHQHLSDTAMRLLIAGITPPADDVANSDTGVGALSGGFMAVITAGVTVTMPATLITHGRTLDGHPGAELPEGTLVDDNTALLLPAASHHGPGCSPTRSPASPSPRTPISPPHHCAGSLSDETKRAASLAAIAQPLDPISTTRPTDSTAAAPPRAISPPCADDIMSSSIATVRAPAGSYNRRNPASSSGSDLVAISTE